MCSTRLVNIVKARLLCGASLSFSSFERKIEAAERGTADGEGGRLFYFALPPQVFPTAVEHLRASELAPRIVDPARRPWARVIVEKPFGHDGESAQALKVPVRTLPGLYELITGDAGLAGQIRPVQVEDVLGREQVEVDFAQVASYLQGHTVLVTGAGGSIGSELCRQIARVGPRLLVMLDFFETMTACYEEVRGLPVGALQKLVKMKGKITKLLGIKNGAPPREKS